MDGRKQIRKTIFRYLICIRSTLLLNIYMCNTERGWTPSHGQFLAMGGFMLYKDGRPFQVLSPELFTELLDVSCIEFPFVPAEELRERSMAHPLFASITLLQTVWFIVQCILRRVQGLTTTQIEMVTLSLIVMNGLLLLFWWHKPLGPHSFVRIDLIRPLPPPIPDLPYVDAQGAIKFDFSRERSLGRRVKTIFKTEELTLVNNQRNPFLRALDGCFFAPFSLLESMLDDYSDLFLRLDKHIIPEGTTDVNIFYAPDTIDSQGGILFALENILGALFAAVHTSMWVSHFPTYRDMMMWRISVIITVALPVAFIIGLIVLASVCIYSQLLTFRFSEFLLQVLEIIATTMVFVGFMAMLVARMALIVEAFVCLRSDGGTTLETVLWTKYIPHFS